MKLSDKEYVAFIAENEDAYEASMELEKRMDEAQDYYSSGEDKHLLGTIGVFRSEGKMHEYYDMIGATTENLKNEYRSIVRDKMGSR